MRLDPIDQTGSVTRQAREAVEELRQINPAGRILQAPFRQGGPQRTAGKCFEDCEPEFGRPAEAARDSNVGCSSDVRFLEAGDSLWSNHLYKYAMGTDRSFDDGSAGGSVRPDTKPSDLALQADFSEGPGDTGAIQRQSQSG